MGKIKLTSRKNLANNCRYLRFEHNWSQEDLASRSSISATSISKIEKGKCNTGIDYVDKLAYAFNIEDSAYLLQDHGFKVSNKKRIDSRTN